MPKTKQRKSLKLAQYVNEFPVLKTDGEILYCRICNKVVTADKIYNIKSHISSATHTQLVNKSSSTTQQLIGESLTPINQEFNIDLCNAFISADIPLFKIRNDNLKSFFSKYIQHHLPSETTLRSAVSNIYSKTIQTITTSVKNEYVWLSIDETTDSAGRFVANVILGILSSDETVAKQRFLINRAVLDKVNNTYIARLFDDSIKILGEEFNKDAVLLLVTDAAPYMVKAAKAIKVFYSKIIHITCVAHALHRVSKKIRENNPKVDRLIAVILSPIR